MTMQDPIADMLTRVRNAQRVNKKEVTMPTSRVRESIAKLLVDEGFIVDYKVEKAEKMPELVLMLKYYQDAPVISELTRVSKPGLRIYRQKGDLPKVKNGLGVAVMSTSKGLMSDATARKQGLGGEVLFYIS